MLIRAQPPLLQSEDSPQWSVAWYIMGTPIGANAFTCTGQQEVCGEVYNVVDGLFWSGPGFYRNEGPKAYIRSSTDCALPERLIYDYGLEIGDSTYVGWSMGGTELDTALAILASIDTIQTTGGSRRRFNMLIDRCPSPDEEPLLTPMEWIEGIGSSWHPFYSLICLCDFCETGTALLCADSLGIAVFRSTPDVNCAQTIGVEERLTLGSGLGIRPMDSGAEIDLPPDTYGGTLKMLDASGRSILERTIAAHQRTAIITYRTAGVHFISFLGSDGRRWAAKWAATPP